MSGATHLILTVAVELRNHPPRIAHNVRSAAELTQQPATATLPSQKERRLLIAKQSAVRASAVAVGSGTAAEVAESRATKP